MSCDVPLPAAGHGRGCGPALELFPGNRFDGYLVVRVQTRRDVLVCMADEETLPRQDGAGLTT